MQQFGEILDLIFKIESIFDKLPGAIAGFTLFTAIIFLAVYWVYQKIKRVKLIIFRNTRIPKGISLFCSSIALIIFIFFIINTSSQSEWTIPNTRFGMFMISALLLLASMSLDIFWHTIRRIKDVVLVLLISLSLLALIYYLILLDAPIWSKIITPLICGGIGGILSWLYFRRIQRNSVDTVLSKWNRPL